ncbi:EpsG family protein [Domibacillus indicus]|uniref:EpsG family protein n=1 Tax=Domibacillus indicus TaxID=1437523 RepID=UPI00203D4A93|nr:EpsG family protein [Domibacillus indicus]MCM3788889.1 EpsG family protein [Domibacillus indicus]
MTIYIMNLIMIGLYSIGYNTIRPNFKNSHKLKKFFVSLATIQLILILSFRQITIGVDVAGYINNFKYTFSTYNLEQILHHHWEIGFKFLVKVISLFTNNEQIFLSVLAILSIVPVGRFIYKNSKMPFLSFALYISFNYYSFVFSGLRQAIAYAIILNSYDFIKDKKPVKFTICVLLASLFHKSALVFLVAYFLVKLRLNKVTISIILLINTFIFIFRVRIYEVASRLFYEAYEVAESSSFTWMLLCSFIVICGLLVYKKVVSFSQDNNALYILLIVGSSLMIFASVGTNVMRVADYYYMFVIIFIPEIITALRDKFMVIMSTYILIIFTFILYFWFLTIDGFQITPYQFFWEM